MQVDDFDYELPQELIAQQPVEPRDQSRLLLLNKNTGALGETVFKKSVEYLDPGDLLVLNNSQVIPARLFGAKIPTGTRIEVLLLNRIKEGRWEVLVKPGRRAKKGVEISFGDNIMQGEVVAYTDFGGRIIDFSYSGDFEQILNRLGEMPLPPYITEELEDPERYQTVYASKKGSAAAPTAGLHFTPALLENIVNKGIRIEEITLHVGLGTFRPVRTDKVEEHEMHAEYFEVNRQTVEKIKETRNNGNKVIAVGTTVTRTLEGVYKQQGKLKPGKGWTDIFIYPGFNFQVVDALITNFHLPRSTLLMLVSAFAGYKKVMRAYEKAVADRFRFYSLGDAMFIY